MGLFSSGETSKEGGDRNIQNQYCRIKKALLFCLDILRGQRLLANLKKIKKGNFCMIQNSLVELTATAHE